MSAATPVDANSHVLVFGYGAHGQAVATALLARGIAVDAADDNPSGAALAHAAALGVELAVAPDAHELGRLLHDSTHVVPTPGLPDRHELYSFAAERGVELIGEFDLAQQWDDRPVVAITGTNGKTTVTTLVTAMLVSSGTKAVMAGNMEIPLVTAIDDPDVKVFVVEASSFRLGHSGSFQPTVATWLNFEPDHLDVHDGLGAYEAAKARIWANLSCRDLAVANADDPVVMGHVHEGLRFETFGADADATVRDGRLIVHGETLMATEELSRSLPHDVTNALASALTALGAGANRAGVLKELKSFSGLPHRVQQVGEGGGVRWFNDSKATTPHAVLAGLAGFESVVLIAGGRNKGVDLTPLSALAPALRAVVAIGEAAGEVAAVFPSTVPVVEAEDMGMAVEHAGSLAQTGDVVVLSPACTSYDWYPNYMTRGDDFCRLVLDHLGAGT